MCQISPYLRLNKNMKRLILIASLSLILAPLSAMAISCPREAREIEPGIRELVLDSVSVKFETSGRISKMKLNGAFESSEWTYVDVTNGPGSITGYLQTSDGPQVLGESVALFENGSIDWAVFVVDNPSSPSDRGTAVLSIKGTINCIPSTHSNWKKSLANVFGANFYSKSTLRISDKNAVYENLGLQ